MAQNELDSLKGYDMSPLVAPGASDTLHLHASDRLPMLPSQAKDKTPGEAAAAPHPPSAQAEAPSTLSTPSPAQADGTYFHTTGKGNQVKSEPVLAGYPGLLPRTGKADPYYHGAIPRSRTLDGVGNLVDAALPIGLALVANGQVRNRYHGSFAAEATQREFAARATAVGELQAAIRRAHQPELDQLTTQMRGIARQAGVNPGNDATWLNIRPTTLTGPERGIMNRWASLRYPAVDAQTVREAQQAAPTQDIRAMIGSRAEAMAAAESTYNTRYAASDMLATAMRRNSLPSLAVGELTNIAVDRTLFNETPHSMRTIVTDCIAPAVVLTRLPLAAKVGIIAGMHLINRYVDSKTDGVGTF